MLDRRRKGLSCAPTERRGYDYLTNLRGRSSSTCELLWSTCSPIIDLRETRWYTQDPRFRRSNYNYMQSRQTKHSNKVGALLGVPGNFLACGHSRHGSRAFGSRLSSSTWYRSSFSALTDSRASSPRSGNPAATPDARHGLHRQLLQFDQLDLNTPQTSGMTTPPQLCMRELEQASCGPAMVA